MYGGPQEYFKPEWTKQIFETNFFGAIKLVHHFTPLLRLAQNARIVNVTSLLGMVAAPMYSSYSASKWALEGYSDALRRELWDSGMNVIVVQPGTTHTALLSNLNHNYAEKMNPAVLGEDKYKMFKRQYSQAEKRLKWKLDAMAFLRDEPESVAKAIGEALLRVNPPLRIRVHYDTRAVQIISALMPRIVWDVVYNVI